MSRHLDLGCGRVPRNPYSCSALFGVDLSPDPAAVSIRRGNLATGPIPFESDSFDSVSAYDFLEHVPRVLPTADGTGTRFPFVELMNEVWRVLRHGGRFYASTPVYPHSLAFADPTHVNLLTLDTHRYFVHPERIAAMYGFTGDFTVLRVHRAAPGSQTLYTPPLDGTVARLRQVLRALRGRLSHVVWEFHAVKPVRSGQ